MLTPRQPTTRSTTPTFPAVLRGPDGPFTPVVIGGYKYVSKISDEYAKWAAVYVLTNKNRALQSMFARSTVIPFGGRIVRWRSDKGGEYTGQEVWQYCLEAGIIQEFAATNTPQQIGVSEHVERTLSAMVRSVFVDSGSQTAAAYLKNRTPRKAFKMEPPFKMLHGEEADLSHLRFIRARPFVHIMIPESLTPRPGKGRCVAIARRGKFTVSRTQRLATSWREGTPPSSRYHRTCFPRPQSSLRCKIWKYRREISTLILWATTTFHTKN